MEARLAEGGTEVSRSPEGAESYCRACKLVGLRPYMAHQCGLFDLPVFLKVVNEVPIFTNQKDMEKFQKVCTENFI